MTGRLGDPQRRARRLLRLYPRAWRDRFGDEFEQLLIADISERPRAPSRTLDVLWSGSLARLAETGLTSDVLDPARQLRAGVAAIGCALCLFLCFGVGIWSQLTIDWQWSAPPTGSTRTGTLLIGFSRENSWVNCSCLNTSTSFIWKGSPISSSMMMTFTTFGLPIP